MIPYHIVVNPDFIGRRQEVRRLEEMAGQPGAKIIIVYGRRRIGKTELLEQTLRERNILKFEGLEKNARR